MSRQLRRAIDRAKRKIASSPKGPAKKVSRNNLGIASVNVALMSAADIAKKIGHGQRAIEAFRTGHGTYAHWLRLCTHANVGLAIEHIGVVKGLKDELMEGFAALQSISGRMETAPGVWTPSALRATELAAIRSLVRWHEFQLSQISYREYADAYNRAAGRVTSAGGEIVDMRALEASA